MDLASLKCRGWSAGALGPGRWGGCAGLSALAIVGVRSPARRPTAEAPPSEGRSPGLALLGFRLCVPQPSSSSAQGSCYRCLHGMVLTRNGNIPDCSAPSALLGFSDEKQCSLLQPFSRFCQYWILLKGIREALLKVILKKYTSVLHLLLFSLLQ